MQPAYMLKTNGGVIESSEWSSIVVLIHAESFFFLRLFMCRRFRVEASWEELTNFNFKLFKCWNFYDDLRMENCFCFSCSAQRAHYSGIKRHRLCNNNKREKRIKQNSYLSPETSDETALKTICRYELKVKITTPSLKNILNYTFAMARESLRLVLLESSYRKVRFAIHSAFCTIKSKAYYYWNNFFLCCLWRSMSRKALNTQTIKGWKQELHRSFFFVLVFQSVRRRHW